MCRESKIDFSCYEIHEDGRIFSKYWSRSCKGKVCHNGYIRVKLKCIDGNREVFQWHRVIYFYFKGDIPENMQVNHIDEDTSNNALSNLNLMTPKENINWGTCIERRAKTLKDNGKNSGANNYWYGRKRPELSKSLKGANNPIYGTKRSQTTKDKISAANSKELHQFSLDGELLRIWQNARIAAETLGLSKECIRYCCRGKQEKHGGYVWKYISTSQ